MQACRSASSRKFHPVSRLMGTPTRWPRLAASFMTLCVAVKISVMKGLVFSGIVLAEGLCWEVELLFVKGLGLLIELNRREEVLLDKGGDLDKEGVRHEAKSTLFMKISSFM